MLLLFFDLDYFKMVNDTLGQDAGDLLLVQAVERISACARSTDILCRLGGDEFVMLMEGASPQDGNRIVREIIAEFEPPFDIHNQHAYHYQSIYPCSCKDYLSHESKIWHRLSQSMVIVVQKSYF